MSIETLQTSEGPCGRLGSLPYDTKPSIENLLREVARLEAENAHLERQAQIDPLTGLLNRRGAEQALLAESGRADQDGRPLVAVLIDCDSFKEVNDTHGHAIGDVVLKEVADRLHIALRARDIVARVGGDEFLLILTDTRLAEGVRLAERLRLAVSVPIRTPSGTIAMTASFGVATVPQSTLSIEEVLPVIQLALKNSKSAGKNRVSAGAVRVRETGGDRSLTIVLRQMLRDEGSFRTACLPLVRLADGETVGYELLARGPKGPLEMPGDFFRLALEKNLLTPVDLHCFRRCLRQSTEIPADRFHLNLFPSTLLDTPTETLLPLFKTGRRGARYCIEVSEQLVSGDLGQLALKLQPLREAGIELALDDLGFGRSSLEGLILLEPQLVKIDPRMVLGVSKTPGKERSLRKLIRIAQSLGSVVVAEGVETVEDLDALRDLGVTYAQGYYWGQPFVIEAPEAEKPTQAGQNPRQGEAA